MKIKIKSNYFPGRHESIKTTFRFKISKNNRVVSLKNMSRPFIFHHVKGSPLSEENFVIAEEHFTDALRPWSDFLAVKVTKNRACISAIKNIVPLHYCSRRSLISVTEREILFLSHSRATQIYYNTVFWSINENFPICVR